MNELDCSYHLKEFLTNFSRLYRTPVLIFDLDFSQLYSFELTRYADMYNALLREQKLLFPTIVEQVLCPCSKGDLQ